MLGSCAVGREHCVLLRQHEWRRWPPLQRLDLCGAFAAGEGQPIAVYARGAGRFERRQLELVAGVGAEADAEAREDADQHDGDHAADERREIGGNERDAERRELRSPDREEDEEPGAREVAPPHEKRGRDERHDVRGRKEHHLRPEAGLAEVILVQRRVEAGEAEPDREPDGSMAACMLVLGRCQH